MTDDPRDELAAYGPTPEQTAHAHALTAATRATLADLEPAFLPLDPAEAERRRADMNRVGATLTQAQLDAALENLYQPVIPRWDRA